MMTYKEKVKALTNLLYSLSSANSRCKKPYDLKTIAINLIEKYRPNRKIKIKDLPIKDSAAYKRKNAYTSLWYWEQKLFNSGYKNKFFDILSGTYKRNTLKERVIINE